MSRLLDANAVSFALIGARAMAAHGVVRSSLDTDFLTTDSRVLSPDFWAGFPANIRRGDLTDPLAGVVRIVFDGEQIDVVVGKYKWQTAIVQRATRVGDMPVVRKSDLIILKLFAGGPQDMWDVHALLDTEPSIAAEVDRLILDLPDDVQNSWRRLRDLQ